MKCPLRIFVVRCGEETGTGYMPDCLKEECAWWNKIETECCIFSIARELLVIKHSQYKIAELMLREG